MKVLALAFLVLVPGFQDADLEKSFVDLEADFKDATRKFQADYRAAATDEDRRLLEKELPARKFLPRYQDLARREGPPEIRGKVQLKVLQLATQLFEPEPARKAVEALLRDHAEAPWMDRLAEQLLQGNHLLGPKLMKRTLETLEASPHGNVKAAAVYCGAFQASEDPSLEEPQRAETIARLEAVLRDHPDAKNRLQAEDLLFQLKNLAVGRPAPDFDAIDEKGVRWSLKDYRGQIVVLDFWGYW